MIHQLRQTVSCALTSTLRHNPRRSSRLVTQAENYHPRSSSSSSSSKDSLAFPRTRSPTPFEIFHLPPSATTNQIKERYYQLVKIYHPDVASKNLKSTYPSTSSLPQNHHQQQQQQEIEVTRRFKLIRDAYELLSSPSKRQNYLRYQHGWNQSTHPQSPNRSWRNQPYSYDHQTLSSLWDRFIHRNHHDRYSTNNRGGFYAGSSFSSSDFYQDHQPHSRNYQDSSSFKEQWDRDGLFTKNGIFITSIGCISLLLYLVQLSRVLPLIRSDNRSDLDSSTSSSHNDPEKIKFRKFIEPEGDQRLDQDAWSRIKPIQFTTTIDSINLSSIDFQSDDQKPFEISSSLLNQNLNDRRLIRKNSHQLQPSNHLPNSNHHPWSASKSFHDRIHQQNLKSIHDLKAARAAAVKPSGFSKRISRSKNPNLTTTTTTTTTASSSASSSTAHHGTPSLQSNKATASATA